MAEKQKPLLSSDAQIGSSDYEPSPLNSGIRVTFRNLEYQVSSNKERGKVATLLHCMSGYFNPGEMTAIMGPNGSGKSVLMDILSGRRIQGTILGKITYAGRIPTEMFLRRITGYIEQVGTLIENLTVFEMLMYTAELKTSITETFESKKQAVNGLIHKLALDTCRDTKIGNPHLDRGISGGQAKRVNIGIALITNPKILFMDEPISGLDSFTAVEVMDITKSLVAEGVTVCASVHSPSSYVFNLFDNILLLLGGRLVYFGRKSRSISFFEKTVMTNDILADTDAEWITDLVVKSDVDGKAEGMAQTYESSEIKRNVSEVIATMELDPQIPEEVMKDLSAKRATVTPFWFGVKTMLKYRTKKNLMDPSFWALRSADKILLVIVTASVYWGIGNDFSIDNFNNLRAALAAWAAFGAASAVLYVPSFHADRGLFRREIEDGLYRVVTFFSVRLIEELIVIVIICTITTVPYFYALNLPGNLLIFLLVSIGNFCCSLGAALLFSNIIPKCDLAQAFLAAYIFVGIMYSGFYIRLDDIPNYIEWYSQLTYVRYVYGSLIIDTYTSTEEGKNFTIPTGKNLFDTIPVLEYFGVDGHSSLEFVGYVFLFALAYAFLAYIALQCIKTRRK